MSCLLPTKGKSSRKETIRLCFLQVICLCNCKWFAIWDKLEKIACVPGFPPPYVPTPTPTDVDTPLLIIDSKKSHCSLQTLPETIDVGRVTVRPFFPYKVSRRSSHSNRGFRGFHKGDFKIYISLYPHDKVQFAMCFWTAQCWRYHIEH